MKKVSSIIVLATGVLNSLPSIGILINVIGVPDIIPKTLFAATTEALGVIVILILWLSESKINQLSTSALIKRASFSFSVFICLLCLYVYFYGMYFVHVGQSEGVFFPFWSQGKLQEDLQRFGSPENLIRRWGRDEVVELINESSKASLLQTALILFLIYLLMFIFFSYPFVSLALKIKQKESVPPI